MRAVGLALAGRKRSKLLVMLTLVVGFVAADAIAAGISYTYDATGRIATGIYDSGMCVAYSYDAVGNRTSQTNTSMSSPVWGAVPWGCPNWTP